MYENVMSIIGNYKYENVMSIIGNLVLVFTKIILLVNSSVSPRHILLEWCPLSCDQLDE